MYILLTLLERFTFKKQKRDLYSLVKGLKLYIKIH